jgi:hypothetical protein
VPAHTTRNAICPVCGRLIPDDRPPVAFTPVHHPHRADDRPVPEFRVCSVWCAAQAADDPLRYQAAADTNSVAG